MGSINMIYRPAYWKISLRAKSKLCEDDIIYKMIIGHGEDIYDYDIIQFISKSNYDKIISGEYYIKTFPYSNLPVLLFNENLELIPLVKNLEIPYDFLSQYQLEFIEKMNERKELLKYIKDPNEKKLLLKNYITK